jgi:NAD(P)-dependent dehydrogenase (short-subunit alcohol dehydrogenase family)
MIMAELLNDKVAIVTGAGSGIGRAIAYQLGAEGARVVASDIDDKAGDETVASLTDRRVQAIYVHADTSRPADGEALVAAAVKAFGGVDVAVNNAGIGGARAPVGEYPLESWDQVIAVNLSGVFYGMRYQIPAMIARGGGSIINLASVLGQVGFRGFAAYTAAKHGVVGLTRNAALEYGAQKIRVNAVAPGFIHTPLVEKTMTREAFTTLESMHALGRLGEAPEVAELVTWLASARSSFVTGAYLAVDGGYLAQ